MRASESAEPVGSAAAARNIAVFVVDPSAPSDVSRPVGWPSATPPGSAVPVPPATHASPSDRPTRFPAWPNNGGDEDRRRRGVEAPREAERLGAQLVSPELVFARGDVHGVVGVGAVERVMVAHAAGRATL